MNTPENWKEHARPDVVLGTAYAKLLDPLNEGLIFEAMMLAFEDEEIGPDTYVTIEFDQMNIYGLVSSEQPSWVAPISSYGRFRKAAKNLLVILNDQY